MNTYKYFEKLLRLLLLLSFFLGISACGTLERSDSDTTSYANNIPDAIPKAEPLSKYGNPDSYRVSGKRYYVMHNASGYDRIGNASWYGPKFQGKNTSSHERYNMYAMTAASPTLPIPTYVRVTNLQNGRTAIVKINDRGPFCDSRIIDLSYAAAQKLGYANKGTAKVRVTTIDTGMPTPVYFAQNNVQLPAKHMYSTTPPTAIKQIQLAKNTSTSNSIYLQVGAFHNRHSAENMTKRINQLKLDGTKVAIRRTKNKGIDLYQVHIGPLASEDKSQKIARLLATHGFEKTTLITG